jgi:hypothetical protein
MSTNTPLVATLPAPVEPLLTIKDLAALLVKHYGLHEGIFDLMIEYQFGAGAVGPDKEHILPGVMIGIARIGLARATQLNPLTIDASAVNPSPKVRKKSTVARRRADA